MVSDRWSQVKKLEIHITMNVSCMKEQQNVHVNCRLKKTFYVHEHYGKNCTSVVVWFR